MNTRKDNNGKALKAWKALGPAKIEKPLRFIRNKCARVYTDKEGNARTEYVQPYNHAQQAANAGDGRFVQAAALQLVNS
jgi:hypothetical protein